MKKTFFGALFAITALLVFAQSSSAEAREHRHRHHCSRTNVQLNIGANCGYRDAYYVRRYARPAPVVVYPAPTYVSTAPYCAPVYVETAPMYVEEVRVAPAVRPFTFGGLSFSWNFFK